MGSPMQPCCVTRPGPFIGNISQLLRSQLITLHISLVLTLNSAGCYGLFIPTL